MPGKKKKTSPRWKLLLTGALAAVTITTGAIALKNVPYFIGEKVVEVVDGDTFIIQNRQPIRLYGLDAPELSNCLGQDAKKALSSLVLGKRVFLREPLSDGRGRVMALVYKDNLLVNEVMVKSGLAVYRRQGGAETDVLKDSNEYARSNHLGIFSPMCYQTQPPDPRCAIKGNVDDQRKQNIYFTPSCDFYSQVIIEKHQGDTWFCTEKEAQKAGFKKSTNCN